MLHLTSDFICHLFHPQCNCTTLLWKNSVLNAHSSKKKKGRYTFCSHKPHVSNTLVSNTLVSNTLVSSTLVSNTLVSSTLVSNTLVSNTLVSNTPVSPSVQLYYITLEEQCVKCPQ